MTGTNTDFWEKFMDTVIDRKTDFEENTEDHVLFDLGNRLIGEPSYGDEKVVPENDIDWTEIVPIDDMMEYVTDEVIFAFLSGANGDNIINRRSFKGENFGKNIITPPDAGHMFFGGNATSKTTLTESNRMSVELVWKVKEKCKVMNNDNYMQPIKIDGEKYYVMIMSPVQNYDMRHSCDNNCWKSIRENLKDHDDSNHSIFKNAFGIVNNVILHKDPSIRLFNDYGSEQSIQAARALFLGKQALVFANGSDIKRNICGLKKTKFKGRDYGVCTIDTAYT